ncbi:MAG: Tn3 family transposase [Rickettsiaceae bacterium]|nr:Tn3 family transposase [Rickettsiaceae bacterium]
MTKLVILSKNEKTLFDTPSKFNSIERSTYFALDQTIIKMVKSIRTPTNKIGFMLQFGHFKSNGKFYAFDQFKKEDINHLAQKLDVDYKDINLGNYSRNVRSEHRVKILDYFNWKPLNKRTQNKIFKYILSQATNQASPRELFELSIDYCWNNKIEVPSANQLTLLIADAYNKLESLLIKKIKSGINNKTKKNLDQLLIPSKKDQYNRPPITLLKQVNQSLKPRQIKENIEIFTLIQSYFYDTENTINSLSLSDQAVEYYATWIQKAQITQIKSFTNSNKLYLYLMAFIKHQYVYRSDTLVDIFIKSVQAIKNKAKKMLSENDKSTTVYTNKSINVVTSSNRNTRTLMDSVEEMARLSALSFEGRINKIIGLYDEYHLKYDQKTRRNIIESENSLCNIVKNNNYYDILESLSVKLQLRVSNIIKILDFNTDTSDDLIIDAIEYYKAVDGNITDDAPIEFLEQGEADILYLDGKIRVSLYKVLLFIHIEDRIKSGKLNLIYSYNYKAFDEYLIPKDIWGASREKFITNAGLSDFIDFNVVMKDLGHKLDERYDKTNINILSGKNKYVSIDNNNKIKVKTPKASNNDNEYISELLSNTGVMPILQILSHINEITNFTDSFKHHSNKFKKICPSPEVILAGILGKGCNIGIGKIANISIGISEGVLRNTVTWCFDLKNIKSANNKILAMINKISLAGIFKKEQDKTHTGSDGSKYSTAVDSLNANYSFKYFGKGKGSTMYTFLDERGALFYSTVISSSEREAAYVMDGILENDVIKSTVHSTDTHGYTEVLFGGMHLISSSFAPRLKGIHKQQIYSFRSREYYKNKGYKMLPSRSINTKLIETHWDDILRFMATIKLKYTTSSTLFKRLNSYAKDHPLYQALKEFGRIIKSLFILTYYDDLKIRQSIEKQLNKVELSNKFSRAVFFSNNQEFQHGEKHEQEINTACKSLIQNAIVLWNYLYLSQLLVNNDDQKQKDQMIRSIKSGSAMTWQHVNLHGEYDFTKKQANDIMFEMEKILKLKVNN